MVIWFEGWQNILVSVSQKSKISIADNCHDTNNRMSNVAYTNCFSVTNHKLWSLRLTVSGLFSFFLLKVLFPKLKSQCGAEHNAASSTALSDSRCFKNWTHVQAQNKKMFLFPSFIQVILCCCHPPFPFLHSLTENALRQLPVFQATFGH